MRVVLLTSIMAPHRIAPFNALAAMPGIDLTVIYLAVTDPTRTWDTHVEEIRFRHVVLREHARRRRDETYVHLVSGLTATVRSARPDVMVIGGWDQPSYLQAFVRALSHRVPVLWWVESTLRDHRNSGGLVRWMKSWLIDHASGSVVPGAASREYVLTLGANPARIWTAPNAVDNKRFRRSTERGNDEGEPTRFLFVGRLVSGKGLLYLLDAWSRLRGPGHLTIAGNGPLAAAIRMRVATTSMNPVELVGNLDRAELADAYRTADAFVFPTLTDVWGLVINEAMSAGLPIITTDVPGAVDDLVTDGDNGVVVPALESEPLVRAMDWLGGDRELRQSMGRRSAERIRGFEPEAWADGMANAIHSAKAGR